jgi:hypothetical protein
MYRDEHWTVQCTVRADHFQTEKEVEQWVRDIGFEEIQNKPRHGQTDDHRHPQGGREYVVEDVLTPGIGV